MAHDEQNSVVIDRGSIPNVNDPQPSGGSISNPNGPERSARGDRSELPPGASATPLESGSASGEEQLAAFAVGVKQAMERQVDLMGRVNDLYTRYEAQQRITMDLMNARAAMHLAFYHAHEHGLEWRDLVDGSAPEPGDGPRDFLNRVDAIAKREMEASEMALAEIDTTASAVLGELQEINSEVAGMQRSLEHALAERSDAESNVSHELPPGQMHCGDAAAGYAATGSIPPSHSSERPAPAPRDSANIDDAEQQDSFNSGLPPVTAADIPFHDKDGLFGTARMTMPDSSNSDADEWFVDATIYSINWARADEGAALGRVDKPIDSFVTQHATSIRLINQGAVRGMKNERRRCGSMFSRPSPSSKTCCADTAVT